MSAGVRAPLRLRAWVLLSVLAVLLLALAGGAHQHRQQLREQHRAAVRDTAEARKQQEALDKVESAEQIGRFGVLSDAARAEIPQNTVDISDALENLQREESAPMRLTYRIGEPTARANAVAGLSLADRAITVEFGTVTEAPIPAFLERLPQDLHGALHVERLEIERQLPVDDELLARLSQGERPDVLLTRVQLRVGSITGPAPAATPAKAATLASAASPRAQP